MPNKRPLSLINFWKFWKKWLNFDVKILVNSEVMILYLDSVVRITSHGQTLFRSLWKLVIATRNFLGSSKNFLGSRDHLRTPAYEEPSFIRHWLLDFFRIFVCFFIQWNLTIVDKLYSGHLSIMDTFPRNGWNHGHSLIEQARI